MKRPSEPHTNKQTNTYVYIYTHTYCTQTMYNTLKGKPSQPAFSAMIFSKAARYVGQAKIPGVAVQKSISIFSRTSEEGLGFRA